MGPSKTFTLDLQKIHDLYTENYFVQIGDEEPIEVLQGRSISQVSELDCFYESVNVEILASITLCGEGIEGYFSSNEESYSLNFDEKLRETYLSQVVVSSSEYRPYSTPEVQLQLDQSLEEWRAKLPDRSVEEISARSTNTDLFLELLVVIDSDGFKLRFDSSIDKAKTFATLFASTARTLYKKDPKLRFNVVVVGLIIWTEGDPILFDRTGRCKEEKCEQGLRLDDLINFNAKHLFPKYHADAVVVFTAKEFPGSPKTLGISYRGVTCNAPELAIHSAIIPKGNPISGIFVSLHELGHCLGFEDNHFNERNTVTCPSSRAQKCYQGCRRPPCLMMACQQPGIPEWDDCSRKIYEMRKNAGKYWCLYNQPVMAKKNESEFLGTCGNGIVEPGEECDCTESDKECQGCCLEASCKLIAGKQCASGPCCEKCQFRPQGQVCSNTQIQKVCVSLDAKCPGNSAHCSDQFQSDGKSCAKDESKICFKGICSDKCIRNCLYQGDCVGNVRDGYHCDCYAMYYGVACQIRQTLATHFAFGLILAICAFLTTLIIFRLIELRRTGWKYQKIREE